MSEETTSDEYTVLNVMGPYREPREPAFSFDYSVQRPHWGNATGGESEGMARGGIRVLQG